MNTIYKMSVLLFGLFFSACVLSHSVWIDVRSAEEYAADHIVGDTRITHTEIVERVTELFPDKTTHLHLYCRSGNRAGKAKIALEAAGYTAIDNAGSIGDARKQRSITP